MPFDNRYTGLGGQEVRLLYDFVVKVTRNPENGENNIIDMYVIFIRGGSGRADAGGYNFSWSITARQLNVMAIVDPISSMIETFERLGIGN